MVDQLKRHRDHERRPTGPDPFAPNSGGTCHEVDELSCSGEVTAGSADITYDSPAGTITLNWNATAAQLRTQIENELGKTWETEFRTYGGPWPGTALYIRWIEADLQPLASVDDSGLTGGSAHFRKASSRDWRGWI